MCNAVVKFNSNSGWQNREFAGYELLQALSHFSYHTTGGRFVLCDLQGGWAKDGVILTDPVVMSRSKEFGPTDLGAEGISSFCARHQCGSNCKPTWALPRYAVATVPLQQGTSMIRSVPAAAAVALTDNLFKFPAHKSRGPVAPPVQTAPKSQGPVAPPAQTTQTTLQRRANDDCAICLKRPSQYGLLEGCTHAFCLSCIVQWRSISHNCPTCRVPSSYVRPSSVFLVGQEKARLFAYF